MPGPPTWPGLAPENLVQHSATEEESQSGSYAAAGEIGIKSKSFLR